MTFNPQQVLLSIDPVLDSIVDLAHKLVIPEITTLPLHIDHNLNAPRAYTNNDGIWVRADVVANEPNRVGDILAHEIGHHVIKEPENTFHFPNAVTYRAEDYLINSWLLDEVGIDLRTIKGGVLYDKKLGKMPLVKVCEEINKMPKLPFGCGCQGIAHPIIQHVATKLRRKYKINQQALAFNIPHDRIDEEEFERISYMFHSTSKVNNVPVDAERLVRDLWMKAYLDRPSAVPLDEMLTSEQAIVFGWQCEEIRKSTVGRAEEAAAAVVTYLRAVNAHRDILRTAVINSTNRWHNSRVRLADAEKELAELQANIRVKRGKVKRLRRIKELKKLIPIRKKRVADNELAIEHAQARAKWPLPRVLAEQPVERYVQPERKLKYLSRETTVEIDGLEDLSRMPPLCNGKAVRILAWLSRLGADDLEMLLTLRDEMKQGLGNVLSQKDEVPEAPERTPPPPEADKPEPKEEKPKPPAPKPEPEKDEQEEGEGEGDEEGDEGEEQPDEGEGDEDNEGDKKTKASGGGDDEEHGPPDFRGDDSDDYDDDDDDYDDEKPKGSSKTAGKGLGSKNAVNSLLELDRVDFTKLHKIMEFMQFFETQLSVRPKSNIDPNATTLDLLPSLGSELSRVEQSDFALLGNPLTRMLFYAKLADSSLSIRAPRKRKRQAVIICIDCSGSMQGNPYLMAAGFALAMVKKLMNDQRGWAIQMFSDGVCAELSWSGTGPGPSLAQIISILLCPYYGGTNGYASLHGAFDIRDDHKWEETSTLMVTDGEFSLKDDELNTLLPRKQKGERIAMILVGGSGRIHSLRKIGDDVYRVRKNELGVQLVAVSKDLL